MIIIGHNAIKCAKFREIKNIKDIAKTSASDIVYFPHSVEFARHCAENEIAFGVIVKNILELVLNANFGAKYLIIKSPKLARKCQKLANEYFFDAKILLVIKSEKEIAKTAESGIDGVIFEGVMK
ncbi:hypothetical protein ACWIUD_01350 [Helicobacter sp. 23-1044]